MRKTLSLLSAVLPSLAAPMSVHAGADQNQLQVTLTIVDGCTVDLDQYRDIGNEPNVRCQHSARGAQHSYWLKAKEDALNLDNALMILSDQILVVEF